MAPTLFDEVRVLPGTINVPMNAVRFLAFQQSGFNCLVTEGLNSCSAVAIVSHDAAILAHIAPRPTTDLSNPHAGDQNMQARMNEVAALLSTYSTFFRGKRVWVVHAVLGG